MLARRLPQAAVPASAGGRSRRVATTPAGPARQQQPRRLASLPATTALMSPPPAVRPSSRRGAATSSRRPLMPPPAVRSSSRRGGAALAATTHDNNDGAKSVPADPPPPLHVPLGLVLFSSWAMGSLAWLAASGAAADPAAAAAGAASSSSAAAASASLGGAVLGAALGGAFAALGSYARRSIWRAPARRLRVVVTGGTRGLGKALAREMLAAGDAVAITGRGAEAVAAALRELPAEAAALLRASGADVTERTVREMRARLAGFVCDVAADDGGASVEAALGGASAFFFAVGGGGGGGGGGDDGGGGGGFDVLICNAGASGGAKPLFGGGGAGEADDGDEAAAADAAAALALRAVVRTNLLGALRCAKAGIGHLSRASSSSGGHLFFMDGAGSDGSATPLYAAYGSTKAALPQLAESLRRELRGGASASAAPSSAASSAAATVGVHTLSPGMMLTDLLLEGSTPAVRALVFNALCAQPEEVAAFLAPRVRSAVARGLDGIYPKFLTPLSALARFAALPVRGRGRFFDAEGNATYLPEHERILGKGARATARARRSAGVASRWRPLQLGYSASLLACALIMAAALGPVGPATVAGAVVGAAEEASPSRAAAAVAAPSPSSSFSFSSAPSPPMTTL